jgi:hypothetical protein
MRWLAHLAAVGLASSISVAQAQDRPPDTCVHAPTIVTVADFLLTEPATKPNFWRDRAGDDAAYLKIRYGGMTYAEGSELLSSLEKRSHPPQRILELKLAYAKSADRAAMLAEIPPQPSIGSVVPLLGESAWRALAVEDDGDWLLGELKRWKAANPERADQSPIHRQFPIAIIDLDDETKTGLAKRAEEAGLAMLAFNLYATKQDLTDLAGFIDRNPASGSGTPAEQRESSIRFALMLADLQPALEMTKQPAEIRAVDAKRGYKTMMQPFWPLVRQFPPAAMLLTVFNQTGETRIGTEVAAGMLAEIDAKRLDPVNKPDAVFAAMVAGLDKVLGPERRMTELASFRSVAAGEQNETAADIVDRAIARLELAPFVLGTAAEAPPHPTSLTKEFPWDQWVSVAKNLDDGTASDEDDRRIAAELLIGADRTPEALALLQADADWQAAQRRAHALLHDLDRRCGGLLRHPAPLSGTLYRFGPR